MNLLFRFFYKLICSLLREKLDVLDTSIISFRVLPTDLDLNGHMNNGRYLTLMDLGRIDLVIRSGTGKTVMKNKWKPMIASVMIRFRKGLKMFQKYELHTRILAWDNRFIYIEHKMIRQKQVVSVALVKGSFVGKKGPVPTDLVNIANGYTLDSPAIPECVRLWQEAENQMKTVACLDV